MTSAVDALGERQYMQLQSFLSETVLAGGGESEVLEKAKGRVDDEVNEKETSKMTEFGRVRILGARYYTAVVLCDVVRLALKLRMRVPAGR